MTTAIEKFTKDDLQYQYGFQPAEIGNVFVCWWIVDAPDILLEELGIRNGFLCVVTQDGQAGIHVPSTQKVNFFCTDTEDLDNRWMYYYFSKLNRTRFIP